MFKKKPQPKLVTKGQPEDNTHPFDIYRVAIVVDGVIEDIMTCNLELHSKFMSNPTFLDASNSTYKVGDKVDVQEQV